MVSPMAKRLTDRERIIIDLRDGEYKMSMKDAARVLKISIDRLRHVEAKARAKLEQRKSNV